MAEILHHEIKERRKYSKQEDDETDEDDDEDETDEESTDEESSDDDDDDDDDWKVKPFQQKVRAYFLSLLCMGCGDKCKTYDIWFSFNFYVAFTLFISLVFPNCIIIFSQSKTYERF